jgi:hypothetical protein
LGTIKGDGRGQRCWGRTRGHADQLSTQCGHTTDLLGNAGGEVLGLGDRDLRGVECSFAHLAHQIGWVALVTDQGSALVVNTRLNVGEGGGRRAKLVDNVAANLEGSGNTAAAGVLGDLLALGGGAGSRDVARGEVVQVELHRSNGQSLLAGLLMLRAGASLARGTAGGSLNGF